MSEPTYEQTTETIYDRLPEVYRTYDKQNDYALKKFISAVGDQMGYVEGLLNRFETNTPDDPGTDHDSELTDPYKADSAWLNWLAQLVGVQFPPLATDVQKRDLIADPSAGYEAGTKDSLKTVVAGYLKANAPIELIVEDQWHITINVNDADVTGTTYAELSASYPTYQILNDSFVSYADHGSSLFNAQRAILSVKPAGIIVTVNSVV